MTSIVNYFTAADMLALAADYPIGPAFLARFTVMSRDELRALQDARFRTLVTRAWQIPFYQRHWGAKGIEPCDIVGLSDIDKLPPFDKSDIMASIEAHPPFGDFHGMALYPPGERPPVVVHTTSGTTARGPDFEKDHFDVLVPTILRLPIRIGEGVVLFVDVIGPVEGDFFSAMEQVFDDFYALHERMVLIAHFVFPGAKTAPRENIQVF